MADETLENPTMVTEVDIPQTLEVAVLPLQNTTLFPLRSCRWRGRDRRPRRSNRHFPPKRTARVYNDKDRNVTGDDAKYEDLYATGTIVSVKRMMRNDGLMQLIVQGLERFRVVEWIHDQPYLRQR